MIAGIVTTLPSSHEGEDPSNEIKAPWSDNDLRIYTTPIGTFLVQQCGRKHPPTVIQRMMDSFQCETVPASVARKLIARASALIWRKCRLPTFG